MSSDGARWLGQGLIHNLKPLPQSVRQGIREASNVAKNQVVREGISIHIRLSHHAAVDVCNGVCRQNGLGGIWVVDNQQNDQLVSGAGFQNLLANLSVTTKRITKENEGNSIKNSTVNHKQD